MGEWASAGDPSHEYIVQGTARAKARVRVHSGQDATRRTRRERREAQWERSSTNLSEEELPLTEAFHMADDVLRQGIQGISDVITVPGEVNLDFNDVKKIMGEGGHALMAIGSGAGAGTDGQILLCYD